MAVSLTVANQSSVPTLSLRYGQDFSLGSIACSGSGTITCVAQVSLKPVYPGLRQDALLASDSVGHVVAFTPVNGTGQGAALTILPPLISTLAGNQVFAFAGDHGPALTASFGFPQGVATDQVGNIYVADYLNGVVRKIDVSTQMITTIAGTGQWGYSGDNGLATSAELSGPVGMAFDPAGNLFIADSSNNVIRKVDANGVITTVVGAGGSVGIDGLGDPGPAINSVLFGPLGIAFDPAGNLYIADSQDNLVRKVNAQTGAISVLAGGGNSPGTDGFGNGGPAVGCSLAGPSGVAVDQAGNVLIADTGNSMIRKVDGANHITLVAGVGSPGYSGDGGIATQAMLFGPNGVTLDAAQNVYIADSNNNVIRKVNANTGAISTIAGVSAAGYAGDGGSAKSAQLYSPMGIALNGIGELFIADYGNNVIRKLSANAASMHFPTLNAGTTSGVQQVVVSNIGNLPMPAPALTVSSGFQLRTSDSTLCQAQNSLAVAATCTASVLFAPTVAGTYAGSLAIGSQVQALLSGAADGVARSAVSPSQLSFGSIETNTNSAAQTITLSNVGTASLTVGSISPPSADFILQTDPCSGTLLAPGANCAIHVQFSPQAVGARGASLVIPDNTIDSPHSVALGGVGLGVANVTVTATTLVFSNQLIGSASVGQTVALHNGGTGAQLMAVSLTGNTDFVQTNTCGGSLAAGASCQATVTFYPSAVGNRSATLSLFTDSGGTPKSVGLGGVGLGVANVTVAPTTLAFGSQVIGSASVGQTVTLHNGGTAAQLMALSLTGNGDFVQTNTCGGSLAAGASCQATVTFYPSAVGNRSATLSLFADSGGVARSVAIGGVSLGVANVTTAPSTLAFSSQVIGTASAGQTVTLHNGGTAAQLMAVSLSGNSDFVQTNTCGGSLAAGASCQATVTFYPSAVGNRSATLSLFADSTSTLRSVALTGIAVPVPTPSCGGLGLGSPGSSTKIGAVLPSTFAWSLDYNGSACAATPSQQIQFGSPGDMLVTGDWTGSGKTKGGMWRVTGGIGRFFLDTNGNGWDNDVNFTWGQTGDIPVAGDWNGDGKTKVGVFRPTGGLWILDTNNSHDILQARQVQFGSLGDLPIVGDWNGDHRAKPGIWRPSMPGFFLDLGGGSWDPSQAVYFVWGQAGDVPVIGDWNGSGISKVGTFRAAGGLWFLDRNNSHQLPSNPIQFGSPGDIPVVGDWNGTGVTYVGVWRSNPGGFWLDINGNGYDPGDKYLPWVNSSAIPIVGKW